MWKIGEFVGDTEGRMDTCIAAAGILKNHIDCLEYPAEEFEQVSLPYRSTNLASFFVCCE